MPTKDFCLSVRHIIFLSGYICSDTLRMFWHVVTDIWWHQLRWSRCGGPAPLQFFMWFLFEAGLHARWLFRRVWRLREVGERSASAARRRLSWAFICYGREGGRDNSERKCADLAVVEIHRNTGSQCSGFEQESKANRISLGKKWKKKDVILRSTAKLVLRPLIKVYSPYALLVLHNEATPMLDVGCWTE